MTSKNTNSIIIVGAGMAGLASSLALAQHGYHVDLVERQNKSERRGSAFGLAPNGIKALEEICPQVMELLNEKGIKIELSGGYLFGWWMVRDALLEKVEEKNDFITLHRGYTLQSFDDESDYTCVQAKFQPTFKGSTDHESLDLRGQLLIGTDGVWSTVRKLLNLPPAKRSGKKTWRGVIDVPAGSVLEKYLDQGIVPLQMSSDPFLKSFSSGPALFGLFNLHEKTPRCMVYTFSTEDDSEIGESTHPGEIFMKHHPDPKQREILEEVFKLADEGVTRPLDLAVVILPDADADGEAKGWGGRGRVTILGDAAHALRPASGLGGSMAFEDAQVLSRCFKGANVDCLTTREAVEQLVRKYENERMDRVKKICDSQWEISEKVYTGEKVKLWTPEFQKWVYEGI
jgi:2-polyprenyl-6-methoxyphenol hydroxylase-like FAD-dependent oxidoreductase